MNNIEGYPLLDTMAVFNTQEHWLFKLIRDNMDYKSNIGVVSNAGLNKTEINKKTIAYKRLKKRDLVKRVKPHHYMINPRAIITTQYYALNIALWNKL